MYDYVYLKACIYFKQSTLLINAKRSDPLTSYALYLAEATFAQWSYRPEKLYLSHLFIVSVYACISFFCFCAV